MRKGRFGVVLCVYPILAFIGVILDLPLVCALLLGAAVLAERDEWAGRQTLQAFLLAAAAAVVRQLLTALVGLFPSYMGIFYGLGVLLQVLSGLVYLAAILCAVVAILRVRKEQDAALPGLSQFAWFAYGLRKPRPVPPVYPPQGQPPFPQGQPPYPPQQGQPPYWQPPQPAPQQPPQAQPGQQPQPGQPTHNDGQ